MASGRVIAIYSAMIDTLVRRAIELVFAGHPELSVDAFTWLSLGSNGRREAVPSSDVDSAVAFSDDVPLTEIAPYRKAFDEVHGVLAEAGLSRDSHGATAAHPMFARTNAQWRLAGRGWLSAPQRDKGAIIASLLVDGRPIYGDPGLPAVSQVFSDLRQHKGTMRLLLAESLSRRAKLHSILDVLAPAAGDLRHQGVRDPADRQPRPVGGAECRVRRCCRRPSGCGRRPARRCCPTTGRDILIEAFEVLQRLRLRYQLLQVQRGEPPTDLLTLDRLSPIDRSVVTQAVREIAAVQRRMDNIAHYLPIGDWTAPARGDAGRVMTRAVTASGRTATSGGTGSRSSATSAAISPSCRPSWSGSVPTRDVGALPDDLVVVQVGDLVHRGPDSAGVVALVDRYLHSQPGQWIQLVGNHEAQYLAARRPSTGRKRLDDDSAATLRGWWADGLMVAAAELHGIGGEDILITHAGLTEGFWRRVLGAPADAGPRGRAAERDDRHSARPDLPVRPDAGRRPAQLRAPGPLWASAATELVPSWLEAWLPFSQIHGHTHAVRLGSRTGSWPIPRSPS